MVEYIPEIGDLIILSFNPQSGHEQKGRRPALVVNHTDFNTSVKMAVLCPITSTDRKFPFHIQINGEKIKGFIMTEQVKSLDIFLRNISFIEKVSNEKLEKTSELLQLILDN